MAIFGKIALENVGATILVDAYASLQNIQIVQVLDTRTKEVVWVARANVTLFASREAKYDGQSRPIETGFIETQYDPKTQNVFSVLYEALKGNNRFSIAVDV